MGTREALVDVATVLLDEGGVAAVTLREVGRQVGVSHNAPYKHFASKELLLAAVAAAELERRAAELAAALKSERSPEAALRATLHGYIAWALERPARFRLVFGPWNIQTDELTKAAHAAQTALVDLVAATQAAGALPPGDSVRLASLLRATAHGAAELAAVGHLAKGGKGNASPDQLVDDLLGYLRPGS
ncbi:TetR/AcrR family transcriptional regulator [Actinomadura alba]|uniref:TetR/AcrR family transcriptional regulator n=1 Tax=Actinomadura alba TaxID=406431 RepID=A0ABR7LP82_9ACTN|nr:TetR/AcrR family transcriptional regulator [Actinomadura alba]MBC6466287.1 TetR/AcrR family transcriptional regulator [Actinomadura alba]